MSFILWRSRAGSGAAPADPAPVAAPTFFTSGILSQITGALKVMVGPANGSASLDITDRIPTDSYSIEETGTHDEAKASFSIIDKSLLYTAMRGEWKVHILHDGESIFRGFIGQPASDIKAVYGERAVTCRDIGSMLDRCIVKSRFVREAGESDKDRIQWLVDTIGQPLVREGMTNWSRVQVLKPSMPKQWFPPRLTLRQCIERVLAATDSGTANYYVDMKSRLHTYDADHPESGWTAPRNVNTTAAPSVTEVAPEDLTMDWDTDGLVNAYYVRGKNEQGSKWFTDRDLFDEGTSSIDLFGLRSAYIDAPDADNEWKARRVAKAAMRDTRNPIPRGSFSTYVSRRSEAYQAGQLIFVTSPVHGLNGTGTDAGPWAGQWAPQPLRIVNVETTYINGKGDRMQAIEFGGRRIHRYAATIG